MLSIFIFVLAAHAVALPRQQHTELEVAKIALTVKRQQLPSWKDVSSYLVKGMEAKPASIQSITPKAMKEAKRDIIRWGPYTLAPANGTHSALALDPGGNPFGGLLGGICRDCMLLSGTTYLTYEDGSHADVATGVYNHHVSVTATGIRSKVPFVCSSFEAPKTTTTAGDVGSGPAGGKEMKNQPFFDPSAIIQQYPEIGKFLQSQMEKAPTEMAGGMLFGSGDDGSPTDYASQDPSLKAGLYINKEATVSHYTEVINYRNVSQVVYITAEVEYLPGRPVGFHDASMGGISATGCGGVGFFPPQNSKHTVLSPPYVVKTPGYVYNIHAHLHDGGINVRLLRNGTVVCDSKAIYGGSKGTTTVDGAKWETIQGYEFCTKPIEINIGDQLTVESNYDLTKHQLRPGAVDHSMGAEAMGMLGFAFASK